MSNLEIVKNNEIITEVESNPNGETENPNVISPMNFMSPEDVAAEDTKAEAFFKALRFGCNNFFLKLKEVFEVEGIEGLNRLERSLDTYFLIRRAVTEELIAATPDMIEKELQIKRDKLEKYEPTADSNTEEASIANKDKSTESDWEDPAEADFEAEESDADCSKNTLVDPNVGSADE